MKIFVFLFLILFYKGLYSQESINNYIEIIGNWYVNTYGFKEEMQKFKILKLFDSLEGKDFKIRNEKNLELKSIKYVKEKKEKINWEMEIVQHSILMPQTPKKDIFPIDEGIDKRRDKIVRHSNINVEEIKCIYEIEDKNNYKFCFSGKTFDKRCFNLTFKYLLFHNEKESCKEDKINGDINFKLVGLNGIQKMGRTIFEREITIYGIIR